MKENIRTEDIREFWDKNPCGTNFVNTETTIEFFQKYDEFRYSTEGHILEELDIIDFKGKVVLEIGLGQGADSMQIVDRGAIYHGIDLTDESIRRVKLRFDLFNKSYKSVEKADAVKLPFKDNYFDLVYSHGVIHHSPEIENIVGEIYRVLKPGGKAIIMLYHKNSINYYVSIALVRRLGLLFLFLFPPLSKVITKLTGESENRILKHVLGFKKIGISYLEMKNFVHKSTDGPDNVWSSVWNKKSARKLFARFKKIRFKVHFLNERHLLGLQYLIPNSLKRVIANRFGWHLWIIAQKNSSNLN